MTTSIARAEIDDAMRRRVVEHLRAADFHGTVIAPDTPEFDAARAVRNAMIDVARVRPAAGHAYDPDNRFRQNYNITPVLS